MKTSHTRSTFGRRAVSSLIVGGVLLASLGAVAYARDADGSRLAARNVGLGTTSSDTLTPPSDSVDWRAIKLTAPKGVNFGLQIKPSGATATVSVVDSRGAQVAQASTSKGVASLTKKLGAGVYYISVSSNDRVAYRLSVR